ncbi:MAG: LuxR C-terminal-related transcriptional regulator [Spirochaetales bacterium]|nr:LuxR C-terminal-related transcriptional regulator [Spirochaetales bacterium]
MSHINQSSDLYITQRNISKILFLFGCSVSIYNPIVGYLFRDKNFYEVITNFHVYIPILFTLLFFGTRNINHGIIRGLHVLVLIIISFISTLDNYDSFFGIGFLILAVILSFRYGFLNHYPRIILLGIGVFYAGLVELSVFLKSRNSFGVGFSVDLFLIVFLSLIYIIYKNDIEKIKTKRYDLERSLSSLITERSKLEAELAKKTAEIAAFEKKIEEAYQKDSSNFDDLRGIYSLTKKELELLIIIYETGKSNLEIAENLHITVGTVKQHLNRAYSKLNVRSRTQVQAMLREFQVTGKLPVKISE